VNGTQTATATSNVAAVVVNALVNAATPSITGQPAGATYAQNATATALTVTATRADGGTLSYQWYKNTSNSTTGGTSLGSANGAQTASYTPITTATGTTYYYVVVTNTKSGVTGTPTATATSSVAMVTVNVLVNAATPAISGQPTASAIYTQNAAATALTVTATGSDGGTLSYQWYKNTTNSTTGGSTIGTNSASYTPLTTTVGTAYYYVVVTNTKSGVTGTPTATATSSVATVTVNALVNAATPSITAQPAASAAYTQNAAASALTVTATRSDGGTLSYQWYKNTSNSTTGGSTVGTNSASYTPSTDTVGTAYYYVVVTNTNNSVNGTKTATVTSTVATVTVNPAGTAKVIYAWVNAHEIATSANAATLSRAANQSLTITVTGSGYSNYQWSSYGTDVPGAAGTAASYTFTSAGQGNGEYYIGLRVKKDNVWYSTQITITVTD
jgi:quinol monooxygenase YgiN